MNYIAKLLTEEFESRKAKNRRYSLRAFAGSLGLEPSVLSKVIRGERILGKKTLERIARKLEVSDETLRTVRFGSAVLGPIGNEIQSSNKKSLPFDIHPIHLILLEALKTSFATEDLKRLKEYLKLDSSKLEQGLKNLEQIDFVSRDQQLGKYVVKCQGSSTFHLHLSQKENIRLLREFFSLAREHLLEEAVPNQIFTNLTLSLSIRQFELIQDLLAKLLWRLNLEAKKGADESKEVYNFTLAFYPAGKGAIR